MNGKQFDIWLADLNPQFGTEPGKTRPVLIIQTDLLNKIHPSTLICPITSKIRKQVNILRINLKPAESGLNKESAIMIDQIRAIDNKRLIKKVGILPERLENDLKKNLRIVLNL